MSVRFRVSFPSGRKVDGFAADHDEAALIASRLLDPDHPEGRASHVDILAKGDGQERVCEIEDGVTEWCRGCGGLKREHPTYPINPRVNLPQSKREGTEP